MPTGNAYNQASKVFSKPNMVHVNGPDSVDVFFTPEAALKTGAELIEKAAEAIGKQAINEDARKKNLRPPYEEL